MWERGQRERSFLLTTLSYLGRRFLLSLRAKRIARKISAATIEEFCKPFRQQREREERRPIDTFHCRYSQSLHHSQNSAFHQSVRPIGLSLATRAGAGVEGFFVPTERETDKHSFKKESFFFFPSSRRQPGREVALLWGELGRVLFFFSSFSSCDVACCISEPCGLLPSHRYRESSTWLSS